MRKKHSLISSFGFAFSGIWQVIKKERNMKIHLSLAFLVISLGFILEISRIEWLVLVLIIAIVLGAEIFNSAIEGICNLLRDKLNLDYQTTKIIRDTSAGGVLIYALGAIILGLIIFLPRFTLCGYPCF